MHISQLTKAGSLKNDVVRARISASLKRDVEKVLDRLGLTISEAISLYMSQIKLNNGIPFEVKIPNKTTTEVFKATDNNKDIVKIKSVKQVIKDAGI